MTIKGTRSRSISPGALTPAPLLSHIQINDNSVAQQPARRPTGASHASSQRSSGISAPEVKPCSNLIDFGVKSGEQAYAETLPPKLRDAIAAHEVLVGMNHRMVLASLGAPERKVRERAATPTAEPMEEWIYGHVPRPSSSSASRAIMSRSSDRAPASRSRFTTRTSLRRRHFGQHPRHRHG
jgi:hypothetical protein